MAKEKVGKTTKSLKILWKWLSAKFSFVFIFLSTAKYVKEAVILRPELSLSFLQRHWNRNSFNTKFWPQWKDRKYSYQNRQLLALFCNLIALILSWNSVKGLIVTKIFKEYKFEGVWGKLESRKGFRRWPFTNYFRLNLVFM